MSGLLLLLALGAQAQEPAVADDEIVVYRNEDGTEEIIVHGDLLVAQARKQLMHDLQAQGYTDVEDKGDYVRMRHEQAWKGEVRIYDDGWIHVKRQPVQVRSPDLPFAEEGSAVSWASCLLYPPMCLRPGGALVGRRKWMAVQGRTLGEVSEDAQVLGDRVADRSLEDRVNALPERLYALWVDGVPLSGEEPLPTPQARKQAILDFWDSRTDTIWGDRVRVAVEAFVRAEVQTSATPFTADEIAAYNLKRHCTRELDLDSAWDDVTAGIDF